MIVGLKLSHGISTPNSGNNHNQTVPVESGMQNFKREGAFIFRYGRNETEKPIETITADILQRV